MTTLATTTTTLIHTVRLVHAATRAPLTSVRLDPAPLGLGWSARVVDGTAVVSSRDAGLGPAPTHLDLIITDGALADVLALPAPVAGQPPSSVRVALTGPTLEVDVNPVPMTLTVVLIKQGTGAPSVGKTVTVRPKTGPDVTLAPFLGTPAGPGVPAVPPQPGIYVSAPRIWGAPFTPADLRIGTTTARKVSMDFTRTKTRIYVVDPT